MNLLPIWMLVSLILCFNINKSLGRVPTSADTSHLAKKRQNVMEAAQAPLQQPLSYVYLVPGKPSNYTTAFARGTAFNETAPSVEPVSSAPLTATPSKRDDLPDLAKLLNCKEQPEPGTIYNLNGCKAVLSGAKNALMVDLKEDKKCKDSLSLERLYAYLIKSPPEEKLKKFFEMDVFQVENIALVPCGGSAIFTAKTKEKEKFVLLPGTSAVLQQASVSLTIEPKKLSFDMFGITIQGSMIINSTPLTVTLNKESNKKVGVFTITGKKLKISDIFGLFASDAPGAKTPNADVKDVLSLSFDSPSIIGSRDANGNTELLVSGDVTGLKGFEKLQIAIAAQGIVGRNTAAAVSVKFVKADLAAILNKLTTKLDLDKIPIFSEKTIDSNLQYVSGDIIKMNDDSIKKKLEESTISGSPLFKKGTTLKLDIPLKPFFDNRKVKLPDTVKPNLKIDIEFLTGKISFGVPDETDIIVILLAVMPDFAIGRFNEFMKNHPNINVVKFDIDSKKKSIEIELMNVEPFSIGNDLIKGIDKTSFVLQRKSEKDEWEFSAKGQKKIIANGKPNPDEVLNVELKKEKDVYTFTANIGELSIEKLVDELDATSVWRSLSQKFPNSNLIMKNLVVTAVFDGTKTEIKFTGDVKFQKDIAAKVEGSVINKALTMGIEFQASVNEVAQSLKTKEPPPGEAFELAEEKSDFMRKAEFNVIVADEASIKNGPTFESTALTDSIKKFDKTNKGLSFTILLKPPANVKDCNKGKLCELLFEKIKGEKGLLILGNLDTTGFEVKYQSEDKLELGKNFVAEKWYLKITMGKTGVAVNLGGDVTMTMMEEKYNFQGEIKFTAGTKITLQLKLVKPWEMFKYLSVQDLRMKVGVDLLTGTPIFELDGVYHLGYKAPIKYDLAGGFNSPEFYFYTNFTDISLERITKAFENDKPFNVPGFMNKIKFNNLVAGVSFPNGKELDQPKVKLPKGFLLNGDITVFGNTVKFNSDFNLPEEMSFSAELPAIDWAGGLIKLVKRSQDKKSKDPLEGPTFSVTVGTKKIGLSLDAEITLFTITAGAEVEITEKQLKFEVSGNFNKMFGANVKVEASFGSSDAIRDSKFTDAKAFSVEACIDDGVTKDANKNLEKTVEEKKEEALELDKKCKKEAKESDKWFKEQKETFDRWNGKIVRAEKKYFKWVEEVKKNKDDDCIKKCENKKEDVGGFEPKKGDCDFAGIKVPCQVWNEKKYKQIVNPDCIAKCEAKTLCSTLKGTCKVKYYKVKMHLFQNLVQGALKISKVGAKIYEGVKETAKTISEAATKVAGIILRGYSIEELCLKASLGDAKNGNSILEFSVKGKLKYKEGKQDKFKDIDGKISIDPENWLKSIIYFAAGKAVAGFDEITKAVDKVKAWLKNSKIETEELKKEEDRMKAEEKKIDEDEANDQIDDKDKRTLEAEYCEDVGYDPEDPYYTVRKDLTMQAFRDIFSLEKADESGSKKTVSDKEEGDDENDSDDVDNDTLETIDTSDEPESFDTKSLRNPTSSNKCSRKQGIINIYDDLHSTINAMANHNEEMKNKYITFIEKYENRFADMESEALTNCTVGLSDDQKEDVLFYIKLSQEGVAKWKREYTSEFENIDKDSFRDWKKYVLKRVGDDDNSAFLEMLDKARSDIPKEGDTFGEALTNAAKSVQSLLTDQGESLLDKKKSIDELGECVKEMKQLKTEMPCFAREEL